MASLRVKISGLVWVTIIILLATACLDEDNYDFPKSVQIPKEGGIVKVIGSESPAIYITDPTTFETTLAEDYYFDTNMDRVTPDSVFVTSGWLSARMAYRSKEITIIAQPISGNKKRELCISLNFGNAFGEIKVIQNPK